MEQRTLAGVKLLVLATTLFRGTFGTTEVSSVATYTTDVTNTSIAMEDPGVTDAIFTTDLTATDTTNITENISDVVLVNHFGLCCLYNNAVCAGNNTFCSSCMCLCQRNYVFNYLTMACEAAGGKGAEEAGQKGSKLPSQKEAKLPGQPCTAASQCVEGLVCNRTTCACPWPCVYVEKELVCDCGEDVSNLIGPIICGFVLGFMIVIFWCARIIWTIDMFKERNKVSRMSTSVSGISTLGAAYGTDHIRPQTYSLTPATYPSSQTVAPFTPFAPALRPQPSYVGGAARPPGLHYQPPSAPPHPLPTTTSLPSYDQIFGGDNPAYEISTVSGPTEPQCPSSAPEGRKLASISENKEDVPSAPNFVQPSRSARF